MEYGKDFTVTPLKMGSGTPNKCIYPFCKTKYRIRQNNKNKRRYPKFCSKHAKRFGQVIRNFQRIVKQLRSADLTKEELEVLKMKYKTVKQEVNYYKGAQYTERRRKKK